MTSLTSSSKDVRYTTSIVKGAALVGEMQKLLENWQPSEPYDAFLERVQHQDMLGKSTAYRTKDIVRRVFARRLLIPTDEPARHLKQIMQSNLPSSTFNEMLLVYSSRKDPLIHDFILQEFWPAVRSGRNILDTDTVLTFLSGATYDGRIDPPWSDNVELRVARSILGLLRDVGFLRETQRGRKEIVNYRITDEGTVILARELYESGVSDSSLSEHQDWGLFGLSRTDVLDRLDGIGEERGLIVQRAGSVVRLTWFIRSMEEMVNVLAR